MKTIYFKDNDHYFKWFNKHKNKYEIKELKTLNNKIRLKIIKLT